jgi:hypothetical protein
MPERLSAGGYAGAWKRYRFWARLRLVGILGWLPYGALVGFVTDALRLPGAFTPLALTWMGLLGVVAVRASRFRCPRCGETFFQRGLRHNSMAKRCLHCGLQKWESVATALPPAAPSDRIASLALVVGNLAAGLGGFGLLLAGVQRLGMEATGMAHDPKTQALVANQAAVWEVWVVHLPIWIACGAALVIASRSRLRGATWAIPVIRVASIVGLLELAAYVVHGWMVVLPRSRTLLAGSPFGEYLDTFVSVSGAVGLPVVCAPLVWLLWLTRGAGSLRHT